MAYHTAWAHVGMQLPGGRGPAAFDPAVRSTLARGNDTQLVQRRRYRKMSWVLRLVPSRRASDVFAAARERQPPVHRRVVQVLRHLAVVEGKAFCYRIAPGTAAAVGGLANVVIRRR